jgi:hypothetical protein
MILKLKKKNSNTQMQPPVLTVLSRNWWLFKVVETLGPGDSLIPNFSIPQASGPLISICSNTGNRWVLDKTNTRRPPPAWRVVKALHNTRGLLRLPRFTDTTSERTLSPSPSHACDETIGANCSVVVDLLRLPRAICVDSTSITIRY